MQGAEDILLLLTGLVGLICVISVANKRGEILGSMRSSLKHASTKYVERPGQRKLFYIYLYFTFMILAIVALIFTSDLYLILFFVGFNMLSIVYFLNYFVLLEPKDKFE